MWSHFRRPTLKPGVKKSDLYKTSIGLQKAELDGQAVCLFCKEEGKTVENSLVKAKQGESNNAAKHLNGPHGSKMKELAKQKKDKQKEETKKRKQQTQISFRVTKKNKKTNSPSTYDTAMCNQLHMKVAKYVNNSGLPDSTVLENPVFRDMIDFCIDNAPALKAYKHMGRRGVVSIQCKSFAEFISRVKKLIRDVRAWYVRETGKSWFACLIFDAHH